jgi:hypothetical protein
MSSSPSSPPSSPEVVFVPAPPSSPPLGTSLGAQVPVFPLVGGVVLASRGSGSRGYGGAAGGRGDGGEDDDDGNSDGGNGGNGNGGNGDGGNGDGGNGGNGDGGNGDGGNGGVAGNSSVRRSQRTQKKTQRLGQEGDHVFEQMSEEHNRLTEENRKLSRQLKKAQEDLKTQAHRNETDRNQLEQHFNSLRETQQARISDLVHKIRQQEMELSQTKRIAIEERSRLEAALTEEKKTHKRMRGMDSVGLPQEQLDQLRQHITEEFNEALARIDDAELFVQAREIVERERGDFRCILSQALFEDPVVASDGNTYERAYIEEYLNNQRQHAQLPFDSPHCRGQFTHRTVNPSLLLRTLIEEAIHQQYEKLRNARAAAKSPRCNGAAARDPSADY